MGRTLSRPLRVSDWLISNLPLFLNKGALKAYRISAHGSAEWPRQGPPPHLTRETFSGRRPVDGADTLGGVFRPAKTRPWGGGEDKVCGCRLNPSLISGALTSLAARCISQRGLCSSARRTVQPDIILFARSPKPPQSPRDERLIYTPHHRPLAVPAASHLLN